MVNKLKTLENLKIAKFLHDNYEECAKITGWETQQNTRVPFEELPEKNKRTMSMVCARLRELLFKQEAIKWIKEHKKEKNRFYCTICTEFNCSCSSSDCFKIYHKDDLITWIKYFFNITEEDLK